MASSRSSFSSCRGPSWISSPARAIWSWSENRPGSGATPGREALSVPRKKRARTRLFTILGASPTATRSRETGMVPTSYWLRARENSRANSSSSSRVSPSSRAHCSSPPTRMSHSWRYCPAVFRSPRSSRAAARSPSRAGRPMSSSRSYRARAQPLPVLSAFLRSLSRGAITRRRRPSSQATWARCSSVNACPYPSGCMSQGFSRRHWPPRRSQVRA